MCDEDKDEAYWDLEGVERAVLVDRVRAALPRLFAVCEVERDEWTGDVIGGWVSGWGLAFANRVAWIDAEREDRSGSDRINVGALDSTVRFFMWGSETDEVGVIWAETLR